MPLTQRLFFLFTSLLLLSTGTDCHAAGAYQTTEFTEVTEAVKQAVKTHGANKVLLVCDIDNTLLAMQGDLGSDQWFEWQSYLLKHEPNSDHLVADSFDGLLEAQGVLFSLGTMYPPEPAIPDDIEELQAMGIRTVVLTSRGDECREATERELKRNGYDFAKSCVRAVDQPCGPYMPYDLGATDRAGITREEARVFRLGEPRGVSFSNGIFMSAGQHKGAMLLTVLAMCKEEFAAVVFVDDHGRHIVHVYDALARRGVEVWAFHYKRQDPYVNRFKYGDKQEVTCKWRRLERTFKEVFDQASR